MEYLLPKTLEQYAQYLSRFTEKSKIIAGGTDYVIQARRGKYDPDMLLYPGEIAALHEVTLSADTLRIGAMATMAEIAKKLAAYPEFLAICDAAGDVGSPQVRNKATMAGNLCNASPAGDMLPIAKLYDAALEILDGSGATKTIPNDALILGPQKNSLAPGQAVTAICIDRTKFAGYVSAFHKIGSRERVSISRIGLAGMIRTDGSGFIEDARLALGAVANTSIRIPEAEQAMRGQRLGDELLAALTPIVAQTVHDNCRPANRLYKTEATRGLVADLFEQFSERV